MQLVNLNNSYFLKQNDTATQIKLGVLDYEGNPFPLDTAEKVEVVIGVEEGRVLVKEASLLSGIGEIEFGLDEGDIIPVGDNRLEVHIYTSNGEKHVVPSKGYYKLRVQEAIDDLDVQVTTYTLDYFLDQVNKITEGLPETIQEAQRLSEQMQMDLDEVAQLKTDAQEAANLSHEARDVANQIIDDMTTVKADAEKATTDANLAATNATNAANNANEAADNANLAAEHANNEGDYAKLQGDYAKAQGDYAKAQAELIDDVLDQGPVVAVNGKTGNVILTAEDINAVPISDFTQLQQTVMSHLAETVTQVINIKEAYGAGSGGDDGAILQSILTSLGANTPATIVFPKGNYTFKSSVTVNGYKRIVFMDGALITVEDDIDIFIIEGNMSGVDGLLVKAPDDYTKSVITFTCSDGHRWGQYVTNFYIEGTDKNGTGIKIAPANTFGIMNTQIKNGHLRHLENAIAFDFSESDGTWCSGGTIMDIWHDFCVNGINFISGKPSLWSFQRFRGQANSGSEFHIKDIKGYRNHFTDCYQWDGMNISIHTASVGTILDGNMISNATGVARIRDKGFRTNIKAMLSSPAIQNNYFELKDNFFGADVSNHWKKNVTGTASISTVLDTGTPNTPCVKLSTGATLDSNAQLTMNSIKMFPRFVECVMSFRFRLTSTDNVIVRMGMKALSNPETYSAHWSLAPGEDNFKARSGSGTLADITSIVKNTTWNVAQIIKVSDTSVVFHINDTYVGELSGVAAGMEPFFEIQNKESANKDLLITDFYARVAGY